MKTLLIRNLVLGLLLSFFSCQGKAKNTDNISDMTSTLQETTPLPDNKSKEKIALFPKNVEVILPNMSYRKGNKGYPVSVKGKDWYEIYKDERTNKWMIAKADLKVSYDEDPCSGLKVMIVTSKHKNAALFFTAFEGLNEKPITFFENKALVPGVPVDFKMKEKNYSLLVSGKLYDEEGKIISARQLPKDSENNIYIPGMSNFKLAFGTAQIKNDIISEIERFNDAQPKIVWAGDLNGDGLPDMILDLSEDYESKHLYFFLSDKNDKEKPLKKVGDGWVVFDC